jgi:hypothetical protein
VDHPGLCAVHLHKQQQYQRNGDVFNRITVDADRALQLGKTTVAIGHAVLHSEAHNIKRKLNQQ